MFVIARRVKSQKRNNMHVNMDPLLELSVTYYRVIRCRIIIQDQRQILSKRDVW